MTVTWCDRDGRTCLRLDGWPCAADGAERGAGTAAASRLEVVPASLLSAAGGLAGLSPSPGTVEVDGDGATFSPRFPFVAGLAYAVLVDGRLVATLRALGEVGLSPQTVVAIDPDAAVVPMNLLRMYVHFSAPMSEGCARAVRVTRAEDGAPMSGVFLDMDPELWDPQRTRLTLLLDPARIKRGLVPHLEAGYPLVEGQPIVVTVDAGCQDAASDARRDADACALRDAASGALRDAPVCALRDAPACALRDAAGRALRDGARRRYEVGPAVRVRLDPAQWAYRHPAAASRDPLDVLFDRPLDRALLAHCLEVHGSDGSPVAGVASVGAGGTSWRFVPDAAWSGERQTLAIDPRLEDLAGNSLMRVFDRDLTRPEDDPRRVASVEVLFSCDGRAIAPGEARVREVAPLAR